VVVVVAGSTYQTLRLLTLLLAPTSSSSSLTLKGYKSLDGKDGSDPLVREKLAVVLDSTCPNTANMSCFWLQFDRFEPDDITAAVRAW